MLSPIGETPRPGACPEVPIGRHRWTFGVRTASASILLCCLLTGCVGQEDAVFVGHDTSSALLIQWTDNGDGRLSGAVQVADKSAGGSGAAVKQTTLTFVGRLDSEQVSLVINQGSGRTETWNGILDGDELRVNVPEGASSSETMILARASAATYNADVSALEAEVNQARRAALKAQSEASDADLDAAAQRTFTDAVSDISTSQELLQALLLEPPELAALAEDLKAARANLKTVKTNAAEAALRPAGFVACEYATQAGIAADDVQTDASFAEDDARAVTQAANDLADARNQLSEAYLRLQQLTEHGGQSSKPGSAALGTLIDRAKDTALQWRSVANRTEKRMLSIVSRASSLAEAAQNASC